MMRKRRSGDPNGGFRLIEIPLERDAIVQRQIFFFPLANSRIYLINIRSRQSRVCL